MFCRVLFCTLPCSFEALLLGEKTYRICLKSIGVMLTRQNVVTDERNEAIGVAAAYRKSLSQLQSQQESNVEFGDNKAGMTKDTALDGIRIPSNQGQRKLTHHILEEENREHGTHFTSHHPRADISADLHNDGRNKVEGEAYQSMEARVEHGKFDLSQENNDVSKENNALVSTEHGDQYRLSIPTEDGQLQQHKLSIQAMDRRKVDVNLRRHETGTANGNHDSFHDRKEALRSFEQKVQRRDHESNNELDTIVSSVTPLQIVKFHREPIDVSLERKAPPSRKATDLDVQPVNRKSLELNEHLISDETANLDQVNNRSKPSNIVRTQQSKDDMHPLMSRREEISQNIESKVESNKSNNNLESRRPVNEFFSHKEQALLQKNDDFRRLSDESQTKPDSFSDVQEDQKTVHNENNREIAKNDNLADRNTRYQPLQKLQSAGSQLNQREGKVLLHNEVDG